MAKSGGTPASPRPLLGTLLVVVGALISAVGCHVSPPTPTSAPVARPYATGSQGTHELRHLPLAPVAWPEHGQAAFIVSGHSQIQASPRQRPAPIASVAKVMTAYVVLRDHPLQPGESGPAITLTSDDVIDTQRRRAQEESIVPVAAGERLSELQALQALLLPSANNIAIVLARWDAGSVSGFVGRMNTTARSLAMTQTHYTDPSGYDEATVSTAVDQLRLAGVAMELPVFAHVVAMTRVTLPVAGTVRNTDTLLGRVGFVGIKTGSDTAAGGCFAFRSVRSVGGRTMTITGVVLGQPGSDLLTAGLQAAEHLVDRLTGRRNPPNLGPPGAPPPGAAPGSDT